MRLLAGLLLVIPALSQVPPAWTPTSSLSLARHSACAAKLDDGRVLVSGGIGADGSTLASVELYLADGTFAQAPDMAAPRAKHSCVTLADGRVFVSGGEANGLAELFDPVNNVWQSVDGFGQPRSGATATLLRDRRVLVAGGLDSTGAPLASVEVFNPQENTLTPLAASLGTPRAGHAAVRLNNGTVLFIGGPDNTTDRFSPSDDSISAGPQMNVTRSAHSATLLVDGRILVAGGSDGSQELDSAELYDPAAGEFQLLSARLQSARRDHLAVYINGNGGVILAGGWQQGQALATTEMYDPVGGVFNRLGDLTAPRAFLAGTQIADGTVLATGGLNADGPQSACGLLLLPSIQFGKSVYRPGDTITLNGSNLRGGVKLTFTFEVINGPNVQLSNGRLLTGSVTVPSPPGLQINAGFGPLNVVSASAADLGATLLIIATGSTAGTLQATTTVRLATTLTINAPTGLYERLNGTFLAQLVRPSSATAPISGILTVSAKPSLACASQAPGQTQDGTSNTLLLGEAVNSNDPNAASKQITAINGAFVSKSLMVTNTQPVNVTASYSGDAANDPAAAAFCFHAVSRTPSVTLSVPSSTLMAGTATAVTATVTAAAGSPQPDLNGQVNVSLDGFALGPATLVTRTNSPPTLQTSISFTPLSTGPFTFTANYSGDPFFNAGASPGLPVNVQKATTQLSFSSPQATFSCDGAFATGVTLHFPAALGLANRTVTLNPSFADGSVRALPGNTGTLTLGAAGSASATINIPKISADTTSLVAVFAGDATLASSASASLVPTLATSALNLAIAPVAPGPSPLNLSVTLASTTCSSRPTGNLAVFDGSSPVTVVTIPASANQIGDSSSGTSVTVNIPVTRPAGARTITVRYSGDRVYQPNTAAATVTFQ